VLVPRPETEILVDNLLQLATPGKSQRILDLGTGSGVIFISALKNNPSFNAVATDLSAAALTVAKYNAKLYLENEAATEFLQGSWFDPVSGSFDFIVSNPPYVAEFDPCLGDPGLCFEPMSALASGRGGYADLEEILKKSVFYLRPGGWLLLEHGHTQGQRIFELMKQLDFDDVVTIKDLSNKPRVTRGRIGNYSIA
jgi:release factor glutamine methyltransferase